MVSHSVKINLFSLNYEIVNSLYHRNAPASQLEALANYHGFHNNKYPDLARIVELFKDYVKEGNDEGTKAFAKQLAADLSTLRKKTGEALVASGAPRHFLDFYGRTKNYCYLFLERDTRRSSFKIVEYVGETDYFTVVGPNRLSESCPNLVPLVVTNRDIYELLEVKEDSQQKFVDLIVSALTPPEKSDLEKSGGLPDHLFVSADDHLREMMPDIEEAMKESLATHRKKWVPVK